MSLPESSLLITDLSEGKSSPVINGDILIVHYSGYFIDGRKFDSSYDRNDPFIFPLGEGCVIKGWDIGLKGMKIGGKRELVIPPELAYGEKGAGSIIPPDSTLRFVITLLDVQKPS